MPRTYLPVTLRASVIARAEGRCEYCLIHQDDTLFSHHIDHFIPLKHGGQSVSENLVLSCPECNRYKGSDLSAIDPVRKAITPLFNPRVQVWVVHFTLEKFRIVGKTPEGRATVQLLRLNAAERLVQRQLLIRVGRYQVPG